MLVSSANLIKGQESCVCLLSAVYIVKRNGDRTVPWGAPVLVYRVSEQTKEGDEGAEEEEGEAEEEGETEGGVARGSLTYWGLWVK